MNLQYRIFAFNCFSTYGVFMIDNNVIKKRTLQNDPQFFGAFINMARLNIFNVQKYINEKLESPKKSKSGLYDEAKIHEMILCNNKDQRLVISIAKKYMKFLEYIDKDDTLTKLDDTFRYDDFANTLKDVFIDINGLRNDYTHYYHTEKGTERKRELHENSIKFLKSNFHKAIELTKKRFRGVIEENAFDHLYDYIMYNERISDYGLIFLCSMFLEREYAFLFLNKIEGFKNTTNDYYNATREVFTAFCIKLPFEKYHSNDPKQTLILNMFNELNSCPKILYDILSSENQKLFVTSPEKHVEVSNEDETFSEPLSKRVRYQNRFVNYALKYIELNNVLNDYTLHIDLGKAELDRYEKTIANEVFERVIQKNIRCFGYINECPEDELIIKDAKNGKKLLFTSYNPKYLSKNKKIGIYTCRKNLYPDYKDNKIINKKPLAYISVNELIKIILLEYLSKGEANEILKIKLKKFEKLQTLESIKEIKNIVDQRLDDKKIFLRKPDTSKHCGYTVQEVEMLKKRKKVLNDVLTEMELNIKQVPKKLIDYWLNIRHTNPKKMIHNKIRNMKSDCKNRLKQIDNGHLPKYGEIATYIAKDINDMLISKEYKQKITSFYYNKIQECLALFNQDEKKQLLIQLFNDLKLSEEHPFLNDIQINKKRSIVEIYKSYLEKKEHWISDQLEKKEQRISNHLEKKMVNMTYYEIPIDSNKIPYSLNKLKQQQIFEPEEWTTNNKKEKNEINLPTNIFDDAIIKHLRNQLKSKGIEVEDGLNLSKLMRFWWDKFREDKLQNFYSYTRKYKIYNNEIEVDPSKKYNKFSDFYKDRLNAIFLEEKKRRMEKISTTNNKSIISYEQVKNMIRDVISETEKSIRLVQEEDMVSLLMIKSMMDVDDMRLYNIEKLMDEKIIVKQKIFINQANNNESENDYVIVDRAKRKNHKKLNKYLHDKRLTNLLPYFSNKIILNCRIKNELDCYNQIKEKLFDKTFELEKMIVEYDLKGLKATSNIQFKIYLEWLENKGLVEKEQKEFLQEIRNDFSHNDFPSIKWFKNILDECEKEINENFSLIIWDKYCKEINKLLNKLKELNENLLLKSM